MLPKSSRLHPNGFAGLASRWTSDFADKNCRWIRYMAVLRGYMRVGIRRLPKIGHRQTKKMPHFLPVKSRSYKGKNDSAVGGYYAVIFIALESFLSFLF